VATLVVVQKTNNMKKGPFKLRSGNKPSISKMAGVSPMKAEANLNTDEGRIQRKKEIESNASKAIREGKIKPLSKQQLKQNSINKDLDKLNYYKFGDTIISRRKASPNKKTQSKSDAANERYIRELNTYGTRPKPSSETKDYYEGQTKKTSTKGKIKALSRVLLDPSKSYKSEKKKERQKAYTKNKKRPSEYETLKYIKTKPRTSTTPRR